MVIKLVEVSSTEETVPMCTDLTFHTVVAVATVFGALTPTIVVAVIVILLTTSTRSIILIDAVPILGFTAVTAVTVPDVVVIGGLR